MNGIPIVRLVHVPLWKEDEGTLLIPYVRTSVDPKPPIWRHYRDKMLENMTPPLTKPAPFSEDTTFPHPPTSIGS